MSLATPVSDVLLLGGIRNGDTLKTSVRLRELTGRLEQRLHAIACRLSSVPAKVTDFIQASVASIGGKDVQRSDCAQLCIGDRRLLMLRLAQRLVGDTLWLNPQCVQCDQHFDLCVFRNELPIKPAGNTFPFAEVRIRSQNVRLRVPNGDDQEQIAELDDAAAIAELLRRCIVSVAEQVPADDYANSLSAADIELIERALDDVAPDVSATLEVQCPECDTFQQVMFDPYQCDVLSNNSLLQEIHTLASHYHWRERDILSLSRERRHQYLRLIDYAQGVHD